VVAWPIHASDAFRGLSACALADALVAEVERTPELLERTGDGRAAGVTLLSMKYTKQGSEMY